MLHLGVTGVSVAPFGGLGLGGPLSQGSLRSPCALFRRPFGAGGGGVRQFVPPGSEHLQPVLVRYNGRCGRHNGQIQWILHSL